MKAINASVGETIGSLSQTQAKLLEVLLKKESPQPSAITRGARNHAGVTSLPASGSQQRLWFVDQLEGGSAAYHLPLSLRLEGELSVEALQRSLDQLIDRHETLRTTFARVEGELRQEISTEAHFPLKLFDLTASHTVEERQAAVQKRSIEAISEPFNLHTGPLIRGSLLRLSPREHVLVIVMHHIISDGWSIGVLVRDLGVLYDTCRGSHAPQLPDLAVQYADYVVWYRTWMSGPRLQEQLDYWKEHLHDGPELLELPVDHPRPAVQSFRGSSVQVEIDADLTSQLRALSRRCNATVAMTLQAAWSVLLSRLSGQQDIVVGMPVANRQRPELEPIAGFFVNTLAVRFRLEGDPSVAQVIEHAKEVLLGAYAHQDVPFDEVVKLLQPARTLSHSPIFQVMYSHQRASTRSTQLRDLQIIQQPVPLQTSHFDLTLSLEEGTHSITGHLNYATDLFEVQTIERWTRCLECLLRGMVLNPSLPATRIPLLGEHDLRQVIEQFNDTHMDYPAPQLIHELFEEQVERTPDVTAVVFQGASLTYAQLNEKSNQLAWFLREKGVGPDQRVGLCVERSLDLVVGMLGILKSGGAYVPLDPVHPADRLLGMLEDSGASVLVTQKLLSARFDLPERYTRVVLDETALADAAWTRSQTGNLSASVTGATPSNLAYVIYTSGSTGVPKGVMVEHANVLHFLRGIEERIHGLQPDCRRIAWNSSFGFDMAAKAWGQLIRGRTVYVLPEAVRLGAEELLTFLEEKEIEAIECTPSHLRMMRDGGFLRGRAPDLRKVLLGGEAIDVATWKAMVASESTDFFNMYGPTECSVDATCGPVQGDAPNVGSVMPNARVYILDENEQAVPIGVPGEIYIGGAGVARGYLNRPELTAERFVSDLFMRQIDPAARMYRTGDVGRWRQDGTIEYLRRRDHQVKIRGFRIELGEIEAQLASHERVQDVVVVTHSDSSGGKRLVAYLTCADTSAPSADELRTHLKQSLPDFMIPAAFVLLEKMPLTPNGKLDRRALPVPNLDAYASRQYEPPRGEIEEILVGIWQRLLGLPRVGRQDNFFELGGHSLLIVQMMERLRQVGLSADVRAVFESSTLADLAAAVKREAPAIREVPPNLIPAGCQSITPEMLPLVELEPKQIDRIVQAVPGGAENIQDIYPLAPLQEGILFHHLLSDGGLDAYVTRIALSVSSRSRLDELVAAWQTAIDRHDILRTAVLWEQLPQPVQVVHRHAVLPVEEITLCDDLDSGDPIPKIMAAGGGQSIRLQTAPLIRLQVVVDQRSQKLYVLLCFHHIVSDHVTLEIMISEVIACMEGRQRSLPAAAPYRNHVAQALAALREQDVQAFFRNKLGDIDGPTAPFDVLNVHGDGTTVEDAEASMDPYPAERVKATARRLNLSAAALFHAAWGIVLGRTTRREDVVFGSVLLGRLQGQGGAKRILGMFINTLPLRLRLRGVSVRELVENTQRELVQILEYEQASLATAQRCSGISGTSPLFTTLLNYRHSVPDSKRSPGLFTAEGVQTLGVEERTNYPITLSVNDLENGFSFNAQTVRPINPQRVIAYLQAAVRELVEALESEGQAPALSLDILPDEERALIIQSFNATHTPQHPALLVHELFEQQVARTPAAIAATHGEVSITYTDLNSRANQLAHYLRGRGIGEHGLVGACFERGIDMVAGLLGIMKAGAAYVPLDPNYPPERLAYMVEDAVPSIILTQKKLQAVLPVGRAGLLLLDESWDEISTYSTENPPRAGQLDPAQSAVYVIYTSGSTGKPKGTVMPHAAMQNLVDWHRYRFAAPESPRVLQFAALSFDVAFQEVFSTLCTGGTLVLLDEWLRRDARAMLDFLSRQRIDRLFVPPMMLQTIAECFGAWNGAPLYLKDIITAGEQLRISSEIRHFVRAVGVNGLHNHYGPTETHVVTSLTLSGDPGEWPDLPSIGKPIDNSFIYILDEQRRPVPIGVVGEIYIGGSCVAQGYLRRPELTHERFVQDPFALEPAKRMYKTGDLCRWREDGNIEYLGRNDDQVKLRGFRIELREIEAQLALHRGVKEVAVAAREVRPGDKRLIAYFTSRNIGAPTALELRQHLEATLPDYMVPSAFVMLDRLPLSPNGKLNRLALPDPEAGAYVVREFEAPRGEVQEGLAAIWRELLRVQQIGVDDNFFELGGHSLHGMRLAARVEAKFGVRLAVISVFQYPTVRQMAQLLDSMTNAEFDEGAIGEDFPVAVGQSR